MAERRGKGAEEAGPLGIGFSKEIEDARARVEAAWAKATWEDGAWAAKTLGPYIMGGLGALALGWRARSKWTQRVFASRLNVSLTSLGEKGELKLRTLKETDLGSVIANSHGAETVRKHALMFESTDEARLVAMPKAEAVLAATALVNLVSSTCADAHVARDLGLDVACRPYAYGLVYEHGGGGGFKLRLVVASLATLRNAALPVPLLRPESDRHSWRIQALLAMHRGLRDRGLDAALRPDADFAAAKDLLVDLVDDDADSPSTLTPILGLVELCSLGGPPQHRA